MSYARTKTDGSQKLVSTALIDSSWVKDHLEKFKRDDPDLRLVEVDRQPERYAESHIPGAIGIDWDAEVGSDLGRNVFEKDVFEDVMGTYGITEDTTLVFYGDEGNWYAAHAFWVCRYFGHEEVRMMSGGRRHWRRQGYEMTAETPRVTPVDYTVDGVNESLMPYATRSRPSD